MKNTTTARCEPGPGRRLMGAAALLAASLAPPSLLAQPAGAAVVRPGIVIDTARREAYVMVPRGGIDAIDLATGAVKWTSSAAAKPLGVVGDLLVAQAEPTAPSRLELVSLDVTRGGATKARQGIDLGAGVRVAIGETLQGTFTIEAQAAAGAATLHWTFLLETRQGMPDPDEAAPQARNARETLAQKREGALRFDPATGALRRLAAASAPEPRAWLLGSSRRLAKAGTTRQFESADGRHVLASERTGDDLTWDKYRWTVFERATQRQVGEMRTHVSFGPFVVVDSTLIYETTPYVRGKDNEEPAKVRAVSLTNGAPLWAVEVREITFRGPFPP